MFPQLRHEEAEEGGPQSASLGAPASEPELEPPARAPTASTDAELNAQLSRRLDINEGGAPPRRCRVFNPYTESWASHQTHLGLKSTIREVDEDLDGKLSFREFLLIFQKPATRELQEDSGLTALAKFCEIEVALERVKGA
ncbi:hypothetical protein P7K49_027216 [Saguinus oedipus]|uniref:EF-hand domain-containing protein n=1 Tax=Saguinus oedipus TaxID=9490 RepID=A0ABQ9UGA3_SAGOE|nr:hypothetical protein P7K49_027216 [Saguinus oedipus]